MLHLRALFGCINLYKPFLPSLPSSPRGAGFSHRGCLNQAAPPLSFLSYVQFLSPGPFNYISLQKLSPQFLRFQLPSHSLFLPNRPFSCIYLQHSSSLYGSSYSLRSPSDPECLPCAASRVGGGWDPGG